MGRLERGILWALVLYAAAYVAVDRVPRASAGPDARTVAGSEFALVNDSGQLVGALRITADGLPELVFSNGRGRGRMVMRVKKDGDAVLGITDDNGVVRAGFLGDPTGEYHMVLADAAGVSRIAAKLDAKGNPRFSVTSAKSKELVGLGETDTAMPLFVLSSEEEDIRLRFGMVAGAMGLRLFEKGDKPRAGMELDSTSVARIFVADAARKAAAELTAPADLPPSLSVLDKNGRKLSVK